MGEVPGWSAKNCLSSRRSAKVYMSTIQTWVSKLGTKKQEFITIAEIRHWGHHRRGDVLSLTANERKRKLRSKVVKS